MESVHETVTTHPDHSFNQLLTTPAAASYLGVKPATLEQWRWSGRGPLFVKLNRVCRYRKADLEAFLAARTFGSTTEAQTAVA
ncbi:helix-turn-helix transcriptional regulator [Desulfobulbus elongatus]|uniref:helix-turn-helix transcriptional regulator n=1 Tax=Desulfobulbus elongatus TaxID=53332 RepID=UPI0009FD55C7|nr:helix-turn-helix domain-containing protein [Desulfobulbus elongatus]